METALSFMMLTLIALVGGAVFLLHRGGMRKQAVLMLVLAAVIALNIAIWVIPGPGGRSPWTQQPE